MNNQSEKGFIKKDNNRDDDEHGFKKAFAGTGEAMKESYKRFLFINSYRLSAAEAGLPIKKHDADPEKMKFMQREESDYIKAITGKDKGSLRQEFKDYKLPKFSQLVRKDSKTRKVLFNIKGMDEYKLATIFAPLEEAGLRTFQNAKNFNIQLNSSGRIIIKTEMNNAYEQAVYDLKKLVVAILAESEVVGDSSDDLTMLPYVHLNRAGNIESKSLIVINQAQREKIRNFVFDKINNENRFVAASRETKISSDEEQKLNNAKNSLKKILENIPYKKLKNMSRGDGGPTSVLIDGYGGDLNKYVDETLKSELKSPPHVALFHVTEKLNRIKKELEQ